jgi:hypothetical protein
MRWPAFALVLAGTAAMAAVVPSPPDEDEYEASRKAWVEQAVTLPAYPKPASLLEFPVSAASSNRFLIDADTLSLGKDGVVRYALVVRSASGAENVSFEGIRCATREQKFYAFGQRGGWAPARESEWRPIQAKDLNRQHAVLYTDFLCADVTASQRPLREILQRLRYGAP